jgi:hypothetical protein
MITIKAIITNTIAKLDMGTIIRTITTTTTTSTSTRKRRSNVFVGLATDLLSRSNRRIEERHPWSIYYDK